MKENKVRIRRLCTLGFQNLLRSKFIFMSLKLASVQTTLWTLSIILSSDYSFCSFDSMLPEAHNIFAPKEDQLLLLYLRKRLEGKYEWTSKLEAEFELVWNLQVIAIEMNDVTFRGDIESDYPFWITLNGNGIDINRLSVISTSRCYDWAELGSGFTWIVSWLVLALRLIGYGIRRGDRACHSSLCVDKIALISARESLFCFVEHWHQWRFQKTWGSWNEPRK